MKKLMLGFIFTCAGLMTGSDAMTAAAPTGGWFIDATSKIKGLFSSADNWIAQKALILADQTLPSNWSVDQKLTAAGIAAALATSLLLYGGFKTYRYLTGPSEAQAGPISAPTTEEAQAANDYAIFVSSNLPELDPNLGSSYQSIPIKKTFQAIDNAMISASPTLKDKLLNLKSRISTILQEKYGANVLNDYDVMTNDPAFMQAIINAYQIK